VQRGVALLAITVTVATAFVAIIVSLGGAKALVTALLAGVATVAITGGAAIVFRVLMRR
jgi:hypothetical protein